MPTIVSACIRVNIVLSPEQQALFQGNPYNLASSGFGSLAERRLSLKPQ